MGRSRRDLLLSVADYFLALFVIFPVLCIYWRGSWDLISSTVFPGQEPFCYWVQTAVGSATAFSYYVLPGLHNWITRDRKILYAVVSRLFMIYHGILYMFLWRGVWGLGDYYMTRAWGWSLVALAPTMVLMLLLRTVRQTMWPPFVVVADSGADIFVAANRFRTTPEKPIAYFLDSTFTSLFVNALAIFAWRTIWCVHDGLVVPEDPWWSDMISLIAGGVVTLLFFSIHRMLAAISRNALRSAMFKLVAKRPMRACRKCGLFYVQFSLPYGRREWRELRHKWETDLIKVGRNQVDFCAASMALLIMRMERSGRFLCRLFWEWMVYCVVFVTVSSIWRGAWNLNIRYLITDPLKGGLVNHLTGTVLLLLLNIYSMVGCCGCAVDGADKDGTAFFPVQYMSLYFAEDTDESRDRKVKEELLSEISQNPSVSNAERKKIELLLDNDRPRYLTDAQRSKERETSVRLLAQGSQPQVALQGPYRDPRRAIFPRFGDHGPARFVRPRTPNMAPRNVVNSPRQPGHNLEFGDPWVLRADQEPIDHNFSFC